jgi:hypothetical protein
MLRAKRIVPIRVTPTCVGTALTSPPHPTLGRASDEVDQGVPSIAAGRHPKRAPGRYLQSERARTSRLEGCLVRQFYTHSPTSATGTGWESTPWHATQGAAWGGATSR